MRLLAGLKEFLPRLILKNFNEMREGGKDAGVGVYLLLLLLLPKESRSSFSCCSYDSAPRATRANCTWLPSARF